MDSEHVETLESVRSWYSNPPDYGLGRLGIPERYWRARISDFEAQGVGAPNADGSFICGPAGTGKTHMATALLIAALPGLVKLNRDGDKVLRPRVRWAAFPEVLMSLRATFNRDRRADTEAEIIQELVGVDLLVLDDLGAEKMTEWTGQSVYLLISQRLNAMRPTIVTSNLTLAELNEADPRLASRLGGMTYLRLGGVDRRVSR